MEELLLLCGLALPITFLAWKLPVKFQVPSVNAFCLLFVGYLDPISLVVLILSSLSTFYLLRNGGRMEFQILATIFLLVALFVFFKLAGAVEAGFLMQSTLPLGMSYYLFRLIHYAIEVYKGNERHVSLSTFMTYMLYLPTILVGPINRIEDWQRELRRRRWDPEMFSMGLERILYGFVKIVVFGNWAFSFKLVNFMESLDSSESWLYNYLDCLRYAGNSYMQFAGYSDIAIGFSALLGVRIMENFNYPFLARNINDFWKRWHISLSQWCRDYIFMPISSATRLPWFAIIASMIVLGLWHEISYRYILWAMFHGLGIVGWHIFNRYANIELKAPFKRAWILLSIIITLNFTIVSFAWIKEDSISESLEVFKILLGFNL